MEFSGQQLYDWTSREMLCISRKRAIYFWWPIWEQRGGLGFAKWLLLAFCNLSLNPSYSILMGIRGAFLGGWWQLEEGQGRISAESVHLPSQQKQVLWAGNQPPGLQQVLTGWSWRDNRLLATLPYNALTLSDIVLGRRDFTQSEKDTDSTLKDLPPWWVETKNKHKSPPPNSY